MFIRTFSLRVWIPVLGLTLLPPFNHVAPRTRRYIGYARTSLALTAAILFARLPLCYHIPWSCGLTYILNLVGWYGCTRIIDIFFITGRHRIPRRVRRKLRPVDDTDSDGETVEVAKRPHHPRKRSGPKLDTKRVEPLPDERDFKQTSGKSTRSLTLTRSAWPRPCLRFLDSSQVSTRLGRSLPQEGSRSWPPLPATARSL